MNTDAQAREARARTRTLLLIALVVAVVGSLGAPLITNVATTLRVSLDAAQWTLTIALLSGAVATRSSAGWAPAPGAARWCLALSASSPRAVR